MKLDFRNRKKVSSAAEFTLGTVAEYNGKEYVYVNLASGTYIRRNDACYVDEGFIATPVSAGNILVNAFGGEDYNLDATSAAKYCWLIKRGNDIKVAIYETTATTTYTAPVDLTPLRNGQMRKNLDGTQTGALLGTPVSNAAWDSTGVFTYGNTNVLLHIAVGDVVMATGKTAAGGTIVSLGATTGQYFGIMGDAASNAPGTLVIVKSNTQKPAIIADGDLSWETVTDYSNVTFSVTNSTGVVKADAAVFGTKVKFGEALYNGTTTTYITLLTNTTTATGSMTSGIASSTGWSVLIRTIKAKAV